MREIDAGVLKTWKVIADDPSPEGEGAAEYVVAVTDKASARKAFLSFRLRGMFGPPAVTKSVPVAISSPGVVFKLDFRSGRWEPLDGAT